MTSQPSGPTDYADRPPVPGSRSVLVSRERILRERAQLVVAGLSPADGSALPEQELGRALEASERAAAGQVCAALAGHPFKIRQAAAKVRDGECAFVALAQELSVPAPGCRLAELLLAGLSGEEAAIVAQLAALRGETIGAGHVAALVGRPEFAGTLEEVCRRRVIASGSPRYRIAGALHESTERGVWPYPLAPRIERALEHFAGWAGSCDGRRVRVGAPVGDLGRRADRRAARRA